MKLIRLIVTTVLVSSLFIVASAQTPRAEKPELSTLKQDIVQALDAMKPCLPIYNGHAGKTREAIHSALKKIDAILTPKPEQTVPEKASKRAAEKQATEKKPEPVSAKPAAKEIAAASKPREYTAEEIASSQTSLQKASDAIDQALKDFKAANSSLPQPEADAIASLLANGKEEVKKALAVHSPKG
jgi:hypothetical protein